MIIVEGWVRLDEGELDRLHDVAITMLEETRKEEGCISYCFSRAMEDPNLMRIAEVWESQEALDAHGKSAHMATFNQALGGAARACGGGALPLAAGIRYVASMLSSVRAMLFNTPPKLL